jgi:hypothetical protein
MSIAVTKKYCPCPWSWRMTFNKARSELLQHNASGRILPVPQPHTTVTRQTFFHFFSGYLMFLPELLLNESLNDKFLEPQERTIAEGWLRKESYQDTTIVLVRFPFRNRAPLWQDSRNSLIVSESLVRCSWHAVRKTQQPN